MNVPAQKQSNRPQVHPGQDGLEGLTRAEIDIQIATAKQWPRDLQAAQKQLHDTVFLDRSMVDSCQYAIPRKQRQPDGSYRTIHITGPSVRFAEAVLSCWGNLRVMARIADVDRRARRVKAACAIHDLEANVAVAFESIRRITIETDDGVMLAEQSSQAVAFRNAILKTVPRMIWGPVYERVCEEQQKGVQGDGKKLAEGRKRAVAYFTELGVTEEQILAVLEREKLEDLTVEDLQRLRGMRQSIEEYGADPVQLFTGEYQDEEAEGDEFAKEVRS